MPRCAKDFAENGSARFICMLRNVNRSVKRRLLTTRLIARSCIAVRVHSHKFTKRILSPSFFFRYASLQLESTHIDLFTAPSL